ncbi:C-type lectin domain family 17, member A-like [Anneissia japonica]|uniref:C-type lectin domain family 17, member A-like n=1 Tax=Anneissia japonica TaxID=1529436 RepID=UPI0014259531|nr:C-type lectin domain family 17, member A-like [Anneissia japonica]
MIGIIFICLLSDLVTINADYTFSVTKSEWDNVPCSLVTIDDMSEQNEIANAPDNNDDMWIGLHKVANSPEFTWIDNTARNYKNFQPSDRPSISDRKCVYMRGGNNNKWQSEDCNTRLKYICETRKIIQSYTFCY